MLLSGEFLPLKEMYIIKQKIVKITEENE